MYDAIVDCEVELVQGSIFSTIEYLHNEGNIVTPSKDVMTDAILEWVQSCAHIGLNSDADNDGTSATKNQVPWKKKYRGMKPKRGYP